MQAARTASQLLSLRTLGQSHSVKGGRVPPEPASTVVKMEEGKIAASRIQVKVNRDVTIIPEKKTMVGCCVFSLLMDFPGPIEDRVIVKLGPAKL